MTGPAQLAAHRDAVLAGQHHIQNHERRIPFARARQRSYAVAHALRFVSLAVQLILQRNGDRRLVFHNQDLCHVAAFK